MNDINNVNRLEDTINNVSRLEDTIDMMVSPDHYERLLAEYHQVRIRCMRLNNILIDYKLGTLSFTPKTPINMLREQRNIMNAYLSILYERLKIEEKENQ